MDALTVSGGGGPVEERVDFPVPPPAVWQTLVTGHIDYARMVARSVGRTVPMPPEDIESAAMLGLVQAAQSFDARAGATFKTFADRRIRGAILDEARVVDDLSRDHRRAVRAGKEEAPGRVNYDDVARQISGEPGATVADWVSAHDMHALLRHLPARLAKVARRRYIDDKALWEIGAELGVTESRACQILSEATERLRVKALPYDAEVDDQHRKAWRKRGCRRQDRCLRGHEFVGYNVIEYTVTTQRKTKGPYVGTTRVCRRCLLERARRWRWAHGTQPFAGFHQPRHPLAKLSNDQVRDILDALAAGDRVTHIARRYSVAPLVIRLIRKGQTYRDVPRPPGWTGTPRPGGKLTVAQVVAIVRRLEAGEKAHPIALEYGVSDATICDIRHGRGHRQVPRSASCAVDARHRPGSTAKLSASQVREARAALDQGARVATVARGLGVAWNAVRSLRDRETYRYVAAEDCR